MTTKIGILGYGRIGAHLGKTILEDERLELSFVYDVVPEMTKSLDPSLVLKDLDDIDQFDVDLVVEAANSKAVRMFAPKILEKLDMLILSVTSLADDKLMQELENICLKNNTKLYVPHGAILGIDGIQDARDVLDEVHITTSKHPRNLDFSYTDKFDREEIKSETVLYKGPTREVCKLFPRNVNVHAILAFAGLGFDRTQSTLVSDPNLDEAIHHIVAKSKDMTLEIKVAAKIKGVTGEFTLASVSGTLKRIAAKKYGILVF